MSKEFFEALNKRAVAISRIRGFRDYCPTGSEMGIEATIEALKEMMVGEPLVCEIEHGQDMITYNEPMPITDLYWGDGAIPWKEGHIGIDGEEVILLCLIAKSR